jgi:hypothetical protein
MTRSEIITRIRQETNDTVNPYRVSDAEIGECINQAIEMYAEKEPEKKSMALSLSADVFEYNPKATDSRFKRAVKLLYRDSATNAVTFYGFRYDEFADRLYVNNPDTITAALHYKAFYESLDEGSDTLNSQIRFALLLDAILYCVYDYLYRKASAGQSDAVTTDTSRLKSRKVGEVEEDFAIESAVSAQGSLLKSYADQAKTYQDRFNDHFKTHFIYKI